MDCSSLGSFVHGIFLYQFSFMHKHLVIFYNESGNVFRFLKQTN